MLGKKEHRTFKYPGGRRSVSTAHKLSHRRWSDKILWILVASDSHLFRGSLWDLGKTIRTKCQVLQQNLAPKRQPTRGCGEEMDKTRELAEHILRLNMRQGTGARVRDLYQRFQQRPATNEVPGHLPPGTLWSLAERQPPWQESQATLDRVHIYCLQPLGGRGCREFGVGFLPVRFWTSIRESLIRWALMRPSTPALPLWGQEEYRFPRLQAEMNSSRGPKEEEKHWVLKALPHSGEGNWSSFTSWPRIKKKPWGTSLMVQWLRILTPIAGGPGSIAGQDTRPTCCN